MFDVGYGSKRRENKIRKISAKDKTTAEILAAVHFEWMLKRTILKMGISPTKALRAQLERVYSPLDTPGKDNYKKIWDREIKRRFPKAPLGTVLGRWTRIKSHAWHKVRGNVIHGNGTVSNKDADEAIKLFLDVGEKLRNFVKKYDKNESLDSRLRARIKPRAAS